MIGGLPTADAFALASTSELGPTDPAATDANPAAAKDRAAFDASLATFLEPELAPANPETPGTRAAPSPVATTPADLLSALQACEAEIVKAEEDAEDSAASEDPLAATPPLETPAAAPPAPPPCVALPSVPADPPSIAPATAPARNKAPAVAAKLESSPKPAADVEREAASAITSEATSAATSATTAGTPRPTNEAPTEAGGRTASATGSSPTEARDAHAPPTEAASQPTPAPTAAPAHASAPAPARTHAPAPAPAPARAIAPGPAPAPSPAAPPAPPAPGLDARSPAKPATADGAPSPQLSNDAAQAAVAAPPLGNAPAVPVAPPTPSPSPINPPASPAAPRIDGPPPVAGGLSAKPRASAPKVSIDDDTGSLAKRRDVASADISVDVARVASTIFEPSNLVPVAILPFQAHVDAPTAPTVKNTSSVETMTPSTTAAFETGAGAEAVRAAEAIGHKRALFGPAHGQIVLPELGRVEVQARVEAAGNVAVRVRADEDHTKHVIAVSAPELRAHVQAEVPNAQVHVDRSSGQPDVAGVSQDNAGNRDLGRRDGERPGRGASESVDDRAPARRTAQGGRVRFVL